MQSSRVVPTSKSTIRFTSFPRTEPPPEFIPKVIGAFRAFEAEMGTPILDKGLTSDEVLGLLRPHLKALEFEIEAGKLRVNRIERPVSACCVYAILSPVPTSWSMKSL
jgi:hypothetical protein